MATPHSCAGSEALGGSCPICLLRGALEHAPPSSPRSGVELRFPDYELRRLIAVGGMGEVWEAWQISLKRVVALKLIKGRGFAGPKEVRRFLAGAEAAATLRHPNIVPTHAVAEHEGIHYFTMDLMKGGSLYKQLPRFRGEPRRAAELVETIAHAVHFGHKHGILHRDLNPANILLDEDDRPYVADFGIAIDIRRIRVRENVTESGAIVCTPRYMSPEQAKGGTRDLTTATDVYGLGTILYHLVTGQSPFPKGETFDEIRDQVIHCPPEEPRKLDPSIDRDLAAICLKCLEKDPELRYGSAEELALELRRYLNGEPVGRVSLAEQALRWCLRHPMPAGLIAALVAFLVIMTPSAVSLARGQETAKRAQIRQVNMNSAAMVAGTVLSQLRALSDAVERTASEPELARFLQDGDETTLKAFCEAMYSRYEEPSYGLKLNGNSPIDMWVVYDKEGVIKAQVPKMARNVVGNDYHWRDYFIGASKLAEKRLSSTYVSRAIKSEPDDLHKFAISVPIYGSDRQPIGVLIAVIPTAATLGSLVVQDAHSISVLVAPRDRDRDTPVPASTHLILLHPDYVYGEATPIENEQVRRIDEASRSPLLRIERPLGLPPPNLVMSSDDYEDPVAKKYPRYAGRWIAGFAPVGNTGFVVIVQTREEEALESEMQLGRELSKWAMISGSPGVLLVLLAAWYEKRRKARRARR
jgi:eukaryotic-like serine/threonine-protein kinase